MTTDVLQELCAAGQDLLSRQDYLEAERKLLQAERDALHLGDWDTLARLYMPLQEARRQRRQQTLLGGFCLDLVSQGSADEIDGRHVIENYPQGTLLVAGWGSIEPAIQVRRLQTRFRLNVDVFLGAVFPLIGGGHAVVICPHENVVLPDVRPRRWEDLPKSMPHYSLIMREEVLPAGQHPSTPERVERAEKWWELLSDPYLAIARGQGDLLKRIDAYRKTIRVDYACEFAHQELAATARERTRRL